MQEKALFPALNAAFAALRFGRQPAETLERRKRIHAALRAHWARTHALITAGQPGPSSPAAA